MAHKKGQGSSRNGRDSQPKMLGIKLYGGQYAQAKHTVGPLMAFNVGLFMVLTYTMLNASDIQVAGQLIQIITDMRIDSPRGPLRFDPKNHNPISDIHLRTVQAGPLRHVVVDVLKDVRHPDMGCVL